MRGKPALDADLRPKVGYPLESPRGYQDLCRIATLSRIPPSTGAAVSDFWSVRLSARAGGGVR